MRERGGARGVRGGVERGRGSVPRSSQQHPLVMLPDDRQTLLVDVQGEGEQERGGGMGG